MAKATTSAQHFLECENCEENPATFHCKTCSGHLCEPCKMKHNMTKLTRNHMILPLTSNNEEMLDLLVCSNHAKKDTRVELHKDQCNETVSSQCYIKSHNGHSVDSLTVYKKIRIVLTTPIWVFCGKTTKAKIFIFNHISF